MAERRMFAKTIIDSDAFLDMPTSSQLLYFHLSMRADDDGFINKPKSIMRMIGCKDDDIKLLFAKKFLIPFESGVVVIKHWKIHNYIRKDTYTETKYKEEKSTLEMDENNAYRLSGDVPLQVRDESVTIPSTQVRLGKESIVKESIECIVHSDPDESERTTKKPSMADVNSFFESIWDLYPVKKGKGQVSESKRRTLYAIGFDKLKQAIDRYLEELKKDADWRKPQNGSTFFNSGYVDYLDENFVPDQAKPTGRREKLPGWFKSGERKLDQDELDSLNQLMSDEDQQEDQQEAEQLRRELEASFGRKVN